MIPKIRSGAMQSNFKNLQEYENNVGYSKLNQDKTNVRDVLKLLNSPDAQDLLLNPENQELLDMMNEDYSSASYSWEIADIESEEFKTGLASIVATEDGEITISTTDFTETALRMSLKRISLCFISCSFFVKIYLGIFIP